MSNKYIYPTIKAKEEIKKQKEPDNLYQLDVQLLSSIKQIPGKVITLTNKINPAYENNKENNQDINGKDTYNIINKHDSINNINYLCNVDKMNINNNNLNNGNFTNNNYFLNNGFNNTNMNFNYFNNSQKNNSGLIQNSFPAADNQLLFPQSNNPSLLSIKSDMKNNNYLWSDIKYTQNSFTHNIFLYNNENNNYKGHITRNNIINNNLRISQLSYQLSNLGNDELIKKKKSTSLILRNNSDNNNFNIDIINKSFNSGINVSNDKKKTKENFINIKEEEKIEDNNSQKKDKKIFFNIENFCEEEDDDDTIYHNLNNNKNDANNIFNCYLKKKKKRKKFNEVYKHKCLHPKCEFSYKTKKQLQSHHFKMIPECQNDSVQIIKLINSTKGILKNVIQHSNKKKEKFEKLYENFFNQISLKNYFEFIAGSHFSDEN